MRQGQIFLELFEAVRRARAVRYGGGGDRRWRREPLFVLWKPQAVSLKKGSPDSTLFRERRQ